jgi:predicted nucleotidyltransferase component of viral defense system
MSKSEKPNIAASILQRLKNYSQARKEDRGLTITNYAIERFLYRLSVSPYASQFVLKGAQLFRVWTINTYRPTRDLDLLRFGSPDIPELEQIFQQICNVKTDTQDGITYIADTVKGEAIREDNKYGGIRIKLEFRIGKTGEFMQIDIGFGDAVNPPAQEILFPSILEMPSAYIRAYSYDTVVAEKVEAMVSLGYGNSRMKDFYDIYKLSVEFTFNGRVLKDTIQATFNRRNTDIPDNSPVALTTEFSQDPAKQRQWKAFISKNSLETIDFAQAIKRIHQFISPIFLAIRDSQDFNLSWEPKSGWIINAT